MVGQDHTGVDVQRARAADGSCGFAEEGDFVGQEAAAAVEQVDGEEIGGAGDAVAAVVGHGGMGGCLYRERNDTLRFANASYAATLRRRGSDHGPSRGRLR